MREKIRTALKHSLWLSVLFHVLLMLSFSLVLTWQPPVKPIPALDIPAYVYRGELATPQVLKQTAEKTETSNEGLLKPLPKQEAAKNKPQPQSAMPKKTTEAIHLVGDDKKTPPKPLVKLLGKGLAAHLKYPKIATDFNLKGIAMVGFILHPDGRVMEAHIVKSSGSDILDNAALSGVKDMSPLKEVNVYLQEPKFLVVGIIFSGDEPVGRLMI